MGAIAIPFMMVKYTGIPTRNNVIEEGNSIAIILGISKAIQADILG